MKLRKYLRIWEYIVSTDFSYKISRAVINKYRYLISCILGEIACFEEKIVLTN